MKPGDNLVQFKSPKFREWNEEFKQKIKIMERCEKGKFHKFIQHTTQIRAEKEGGIVNIMEKNGQIITCQREILHECIEKMKRISGILDENTVRPWNKVRRIRSEFEDEGVFDSVEFEEIINMEGEHIEWFKRAISFDFIHLTPVRLVMKSFFSWTGKVDWNIVDLDILQINEYCLAQRLIPLNKIAPKIAGVDDIRPIMIQRHLIKFVEWSYAKAFKNYNNLVVDPCQVGFTSKLGTQVHISKIISRMKSKGQGKNFTFFDLSDAYNRSKGKPYTES